MAKPRTYRLLCPIARALDRIGDRWTLLIIRDLHAGPARYSELQQGLTGIAANLLADRLAKLVDDGIARQVDAGHGASVYELTDFGKQTSDIIFELAKFGARFEPAGDVVTQGNLRTVATTLSVAANRVATPEMNFDAAVVVDGEQMHLNVSDGQASMRYEKCPEPDLVFSTSYADLLAVTEAELGLDSLVKEHGELKVISPGKEKEFSTLMSRIVTLLQEA